MTKTRVRAVISNWKAGDPFACEWLRVPATKQTKGLLEPLRGLEVLGQALAHEEPRAVHALLHRR